MKSIHRRSAERKNPASSFPLCAGESGQVVRISRHRPDRASSHTHTHTHHPAHFARFSRPRQSLYAPHLPECNREAVPGAAGLSRQMRFPIDSPNYTKAVKSRLRRKSISIIRYFQEPTLASPAVDMNQTLGVEKHWRARDKSPDKGVDKSTGVGGRSRSIPREIRD